MSPFDVACLFVGVLGFLMAVVAWQDARNAETELTRCLREHRLGRR